MTEILNAQYQSVFSTPTAYTTIGPEEAFLDPLLDIVIKLADMKAALSSIPTWSSPGPDGITPFFLKTYAEEIAPALCELWRKSLDSGIMPDDINLAYITPIFKGGDKSTPANYRPVALTNHITKAFEKILKNCIVNHLAINKFLNCTQHGFCSGRSTLTNLIEYYESILLLLQHHSSVDAIYLDYSKAFDKCDHDIILAKLHNLGIRGKINHWISGFLKRRQQMVVIQGAMSTPIRCTSGVPQGSVLGPLLFLILMYDINRDITNSILSSFADDTKLWKGTSTLDQEVMLQEDLDLIYAWAALNNMMFNSTKFQNIRFAQKLSLTSYTNDTGELIKQLQTVKDLGIFFSSDVSFEHHIRATINKGKQLAGWIRRTFFTRSPGVMLTLLKQLIYPTVEYNSVLWSPNTQELISLIESVQNNFIRMIKSEDTPENMDYWDRLKHFKLYSMQRRRERYAIIYVWKVIHNLYPNPGIDLNNITADHNTHPNQGIQVNLHQRSELTAHHDTNLPKWLENRSILERSCKLYNLLPIKLRQTLNQDQEPCLSGFKANLDKWISRIPDQPTVQGRFRPAATNSIIHQVAYISHEVTQSENNRNNNRANKRRRERNNNYGLLAHRNNNRVLHRI